LTSSSAVLKAERDKTRFEKDIDAARRALRSAEEEVKQYRRVQATEAAEAIVQNMQRRLMLMNDVAGWKWNHRQEIVDAVREHESLGRLRERGKELGIDPKVVDRFFQAQFEAAKLLQQDRIADWQKHNAMAFVPGDLNKDLRPQIDKINNELLENLARMMPYWTDKELSLPDLVRREAPRVIAGQGINAAVRAAALRGLLES
jgi:chorismate mutase-like protein